MKDLTLDELRPLLVAAMLPHVPFEGWSKASVASAARDLAIPGDVAALVFASPFDMVDAYITQADVQMRAALDTPHFAKMKVRKKITTAIRTRLEQAIPHREAVRRAVAVLGLPTNAPRAPALTWRTADSIWRLCGDTSTDLNHYSKRALAGGVYASTLLVWLNDDSEDFAESWAFLDRRIEGVMQIEKLKAKLKHFSGGERISLPRFFGRLRYPVEN